MQTVRRVVFFPARAITHLKSPLGEICAENYFFIFNK